MARKKFLTDSYSAAARAWAQRNLRYAALLCLAAMLMILIWPLYTPWWVLTLIFAAIAICIWRMGKGKSVPILFLAAFYGFGSFLREEEESAEIYREHADKADTLGVLRYSSEAEAEEELDDLEGDYARHVRVRDEQRDEGDFSRGEDDGEEVWRF